MYCEAGLFIVSILFLSRQSTQVMSGAGIIFQSFLTDLFIREFAETRRCEESVLQNFANKI